MRENSFEVIKTILVEKAGKAADDITMETALGDLGIDSFDFIEFVFYVEDEFDIQIDVNSNQSDMPMKTVGDIVAAVDKLIAAKGQTEPFGSAAAA